MMMRTLKRRNFNPRSRVGNDYFIAITSYKLHISIHVPAWGTTADRVLSFSLPLYFNPRSRVGNDKGSYGIAGSRFTISIHVPAWGTTTRKIWNQTFWWDFNPRSRVGNDRYQLIRNNRISISLHVPAWGTTLYPSVMHSESGFQSTFPRGERQS